MLISLSVNVYDHHITIAEKNNDVARSKGATIKCGIFDLESAQTQCLQHSHARDTMRYEFLGNKNILRTSL